MTAIYARSVIVLLVFSVVLCVKAELEIETANRPNILFIVADDLGWDDVSFHGSEQVLTPNIDLLAYTGVALERYYTHCVCTPSRAALLTGKYAHTTGTHGYPLTNGEDRGLPLSEKVLPEYLKELGYTTHLVGKWHLGLSRDEYLPTSRGFDSHFGYRGGLVDYYEYITEEIWNVGKVTGFDLYRNLTPAWEVEGYMTDILTEEAKTIIKNHDKSKPLFLMLSHMAPHSGNDGALLQAPPEIVRSMRHVENAERRIFSAMMKKLDDSVGEIVKTLSEQEILDKTIIVFISDNGGLSTGNSQSSVNYASNWPLRGSKFTPFEGGIRGAALLWAPQLSPSNHLWTGYMHVVDWLPTLLGAVGATKPTNIDGIDLWSNIISNLTSPREEIFEIFTYGADSFNSIIQADYKLVTGSINKEYSKHLGSDMRGIIGDGPSYKKAIENCEIYSVLKKMRYKFKIKDIVTPRDNISVNCPQMSYDTELCNPDEGTSCLYNIRNDPCELKDLSKTHPEVLERLKSRLQNEMRRVVDRPAPVYRDPRALPSLHNYAWSTWANEIAMPS